MQKIVETRTSLSNTIKYTSTIMRNPSLHNSDKGVTHDCAHSYVSWQKETLHFLFFKDILQNFEVYFWVSKHYLVRKQHFFPCEFIRAFSRQDNIIHQPQGIKQKN